MTAKKDYSVLLEGVDARDLLPKVESTVSRSRASVTPAGLDAFFGKWPGDETDDQLAKAMKDLS